MDHLDDIAVDDLREALAELSESRAAIRLLAAIAYKHGVTQTELAEWFDVERKTVYNWLHRLDTDSLVTAATDAHRSGRNRKLDDDQWAEFERTVREYPTTVGYDRSTWTPRLVQRYLEEIYDVSYSVPSCRRLMKEAGLQYQRSETSQPRDVDSSRSKAVDQSNQHGRWVPID